MKCAECMKKIYLLDELTEGERKKLHDHLASCDECLKVYQQLLTDRKIFKRVLSDSIDIDHQRLTNRIMAAVKSTENFKPSWTDMVLQQLQFRPVKYAMAMLSLLLIIFFIGEHVELTAEDKSLSLYRSFPTLKTVDLNSSLFHEPVKQRAMADEPAAVTTLNLFDCIKACKANEDRNKCEQCKIAYFKLKQYEGI